MGSQKSSTPASTIGANRDIDGINSIHNVKAKEPAPKQEFLEALTHKPQVAEMTEPVKSEPEPI